MPRALAAILDAAVTAGEATVPDALLGCWRRNWIQFGANGTRERQVKVIWLQTSSGMGDVRIDASQADHETDSSCGITVVDESTTPYITADWLDGPRGFAQQAVSNFPEKGWLTWDGPALMRELAPSGAYVEEWERFPDSGGHIAHLSAPDAPTLTNLYVAGDHALLCVQSQLPGGLHQFSWGRRSAGSETMTVEVSTVASAVGESLDLDQRWTIESYRNTSSL